MASMNVEDMVEKKLKGLAGVKNPVEAISMLQNVLTMDGLMPSLPGSGGPVARDGDWVIGLDRHPLSLILPPLPPVPLGVFPVPFVGRISCGNYGVKGGGLIKRNLAYSGVSAKCRLISHLGPLLPGLPGFPIVSLMGLKSPKVALYPKSPSGVKVRVRGKDRDVLICGPVSVRGGCSTSFYVIVPSQTNIEIK